MKYWEFVSLVKIIFGAALIILALTDVTISDWWAIGGVLIILFSEA